MGEEKMPPRTIKVVDRRRFTTEGDPRGDRPPEVKPASNEVQVPPAGSVEVEKAPKAPETRGSVDSSAAPTTSPPVEKSSGAATSPDFVELVVMLAQQAELLLVGAEGFEAEPEQARRMIDYLAALEAKTSGNLSRDEKQILSNAVFQLRTLFVQSR